MDEEFLSELVLIDSTGDLMVVPGFETESGYFIIIGPFDNRYFECLGEL